MCSQKVYTKDDEVGFYFNNLAGAVESGKLHVLCSCKTNKILRLCCADDQKEINKAVLIAFFEENAPERLEEVDTLLAENEGRPDPSRYVELVWVKYDVNRERGGVVQTTCGGTPAPRK